MTILEVQ